ETPPFHWTAAALIAIAMGSQTSASRHLAVPDMVLPLATLAVHGLAHDSRLAGGREERTPRRLGIVCALLLGAAAGAALSVYSVWPGLLLAAALLALAGIFALRSPRRWRRPREPTLETSSTDLTRSRLTWGGGRAHFGWHGREP